jgi:1-acyl-sn-glycerol-3-phosphate acyltransferase
VTSDVAWARSAPAGAVRELLLSTLFRGLIALYARRTVTGREHLAGLDGPVLFVANHASHMDTPLLLRALPRPWLRRTVVAAAADYFYGSAMLAHAVSLAFATVPVERDAGADGASVLEQLLDDGWSLVIYAEGTRSRDGTVGRLHGGAAVLAAQRGLPIVPVHVSGTHATMPVGRGWMRRGPGLRRREVGVAFGAPIHPDPALHRTEVMERVRAFLAAEGAATTPDERARRLRDRRRRSRSAA